MADFLLNAGFEGGLISIDASRRMVRRARGRCRGRLKSAVILADVNRLPIKSNSLDGVMCTFSLTTVRDPDRTVEEFARVLASGKRLLVLDNQKPSHPAAMVLYPMLVPISRMFCHTHIDREIGGMLGECEELDLVKREEFMGGMVVLHECKKHHESPITDVKIGT